MNVTKQWKSKKHIQLLEELQYKGILTHLKLPHRQLTFPTVTQSDIKKGAFANSVFALSSKILPEPVQSLTQVYSTAWNVFIHTHKAVESATFEFKFVYAIRMTLLLLSTKLVKEISALMKIFHIINLAKFIYDGVTNEQKTQVEEILHEISQIPIFIFSYISYTLYETAVSFPTVIRDYRAQWLNLKEDSDILKQYKTRKGKFSKNILSVQFLEKKWNGHKNGFSDFMKGDKMSQGRIKQLMIDVKLVMDRKFE
jgi:hypothetical protein